VPEDRLAGIRRTIKDAALAPLARKPGRPGSARDWQLEAVLRRCGGEPIHHAQVLPGRVITSRTLLQYPTTLDTSVER
jgi:hypothetical protein